MWRNNTITVDGAFTVGEILDNVGTETLLEAMNIKDIVKYLQFAKVNYEMDENSIPIVPNEVKANAKLEIFNGDVVIDEYDIPFDFLSDEYINDVYKERYSYKYDKNIRNYISEVFDINAHAYSDDELIEFIKEELKSYKY